MFTLWHQVALCGQTHRATKRYRMLMCRYGELLRANPGAVGLVDLKRLKEELPIAFPAQRPPAYVAGGDADCIVDVQAVQVRAGAHFSTVSRILMSATRQAEHCSHVQMCTKDAVPSCKPIRGGCRQMQELAAELGVEPVIHARTAHDLMLVSLQRIAASYTTFVSPSQMRGPRTAWTSRNHSISWGLLCRTLGGRRLRSDWTNGCKLCRLDAT